VITRRRVDSRARVPGCRRDLAGVSPYPIPP